MLPPVELVGAGVSLLFLAAFGSFFLRTRMGIATRAVADSQQVAMGINVQRYFALAWAMAGIVSALGGVVWGATLGVLGEPVWGRSRPKTLDLDPVVYRRKWPACEHE